MSGYIDAFEPGWLEVLDQQAQTVPAGMQCLLILDGAFVPGLAARLRACGAHPQVVFERWPGVGPDVLELSPCVVAHRPKQPGWRSLLDLCNTRPMVTVLTTPETAAQLADRLARWSIVNAAGTTFHLRWADTRRLPAIAGALRPEQLAELIGPASQWHCIGRDGRWHRLPVPPEGAHPTATEDWADPVLDEAQCAALVHDSEADEMLAVLARDLGELWQTTRPSWRHAQACRALQSADRCEVRDIPGRLNRVREVLVKSGDKALTGG